jgi:hypothetical protein
MAERWTMVGDMKEDGWLRATGRERFHYHEQHIPPAHGDSAGRTAHRVADADDTDGHGGVPQGIDEAAERDSAAGAEGYETYRCAGRGMKAVCPADGKGIPSIPGKEHMQAFPVPPDDREIAESEVNPPPGRTQNNDPVKTAAVDLIQRLLQIGSILAGDPDDLRAGKRPPRGRRERVQVADDHGRYQAEPTRRVGAAVRRNNNTGMTRKTSRKFPRRRFAVAQEQCSHGQREMVR